MKIIRIGNDITVSWKIYTREGEIPMQGKSIHLWLVSSPYKREIANYSIDGNAIGFTIDASAITKLGVYKLTLKILDSHASSLDFSYDLNYVFQIVTSTYGGDVSSDNNIAIDSYIDYSLSQSQQQPALTFNLLASGNTYAHNLNSYPSVTVLVQTTNESGTAEYEEVAATVVYLDNNTIKIEYSPSPLAGIVYVV